VDWKDSDEGEWRGRFRRFGSDYAEDHLVSGWSRAGLEGRLRLFEKLIGEALPGNSLVLDLGCGAGTYVRFLASLGHRVVGLDYSMPSLRRAYDADPDHQADYLPGDAYRLPFLDGYFDAVITIGVLQVLSRPEQVFAEICRILRPGGLLVLEFLNAFEVVSAAGRLLNRLGCRPARVRFYSPNHMGASLFACGFKIEQRAGVYLPPRNLPILGSILERESILRLVESVPGLPALAAHAFILASIKTRGRIPGCFEPS
jgi:ubiquinone/menaquinone biosynthesis C-methylase UbiE